MLASGGNGDRGAPSRLVLPRAAPTTGVCRRVPVGAGGSRPRYPETETTAGKAEGQQVDMQLDPCISHSIDQIDPRLNANRHEPERVPPLRAALRLFAHSLNRPQLVDPQSDESFGAMLAGSKVADAGAAALASIMRDDAPHRASVCLIKASMQVIGVAQADELDERERVKALAVRGSPSLAVQARDAVGAPPHVVVTLAAPAAGGGKAATICLEPEGETTMRASLFSSSGKRRIIASGQMPPAAVHRLFAALPVRVQRAARVPQRATHAPDYIRSALAEFLERRLRLHVLCTAAERDGVSRPVVLDHTYLRDARRDQRSLAGLRAVLHPSSSTCLCAAHGLSCTWPAAVEVTVECCGRPLEENPNGSFCCPCHASAVDTNGNARFSVQGHCTERVTLSVCCMHRSESNFRRGLCVDAVALSDSDRKELATILISMVEYEGRTRALYAEKSEAGAERVRQHVVGLAKKFREAMDDIYRLQAASEHPAVQNARELLKRDVIAVDMLRAGGVFRRTVKRGTRRGTMYLSRCEAAEQLSPEEADLIDTHASLFRKA